MKSVSNSIWAATSLFIVLACSMGQFPEQEMNLSFHLDRNQLVLDQLEIGGHEGRFVIGTAYSETLVGSSFVSRHELPPTPFHFTFRDAHTDVVTANVVDLGGEMDAIIGADVLWPFVVIDYSNRLLTRFSRSFPPVPGYTQPWRDMPRYPLTIDGRKVQGVIDSAVPDTLIVPRTMIDGSRCERCTVDVEIAGVRFEQLTVRAADIEDVRIGNRVLEHFLVTIDYRGKTATLEKR